MVITKDQSRVISIITLTIILIFMLYQVINTQLQTSIFDVWTDLIRIPWAGVFITGFSINTFLLYCWIFWKEPNWVSRLGWFIALTAMGSISICAYIILQLIRLKPGMPLETIITQKTKIVITESTKAAGL